jgi:hypothetical protein
MISADIQTINLRNKANSHAENIQLQKKRDYYQRRRIRYPFLCDTGLRHWALNSRRFERTNLLHLQEYECPRIIFIRQIYRWSYSDWVFSMKLQTPNKRWRSIKSQKSRCLIYISHIQRRKKVIHNGKGYAYSQMNCMILTPSILKYSKY